MKFFLFSFIVFGFEVMPMLAQPVITNQSTGQTILAGGNAIFAVDVSNANAFTYQWQLNDTNLPDGIITTVAGGGGGGDGGLATSAGLGQIYGDVAVDAIGDIFIPDSEHNRIRKVSTNGIITTVAGNGAEGYTGDGGPATNATFAMPNGVALDASGNLFIADSQNNCIRKVSPNGNIMTVAGNGNPGYSGDGSAATNASLSCPNCVAVDAYGNLLIADTDNNRIRKVNTNGIITTIAGNGNEAFSGDGGAAIHAAFYFPSGVAEDASGNLFIADTGNFRIRKVSTNGIITTVAGNGYSRFDQGGYSGDGGAATNAALNYPQSVAVDFSGNLFIADTDNNRVRKVSTNGIITTVAGDGAGGYFGDGGAATSAGFYYTFGVAVDAFDNLFISDEANDRIRKVTNTQGPTLALNALTLADSGPYQAIVTGSGGSVTSSPAILTVVTFPTIGQEPQSQYGAIGLPADISVTANGTAPLAYQWMFNGTPITDGTNANLILPTVTTNNAGNYTVVITNAYGSVTSSPPALLTVYVAPSIVSQPVSQAVWAGVNVSFNSMATGTGPLTYQWQLNGINIPSGIITTIAGNGTGGYFGDGGPATNANLSYPYGVAMDAPGNLYIADNGNNIVRKVDTSGIITTVAGNGNGGYSGDGGAATNANLSSPYTVAVDTSGQLFIADNANQVIRKVDINGIITTFAGNGIVPTNYFGDGGLAKNATLNNPNGVAIDACGNLYIADNLNNCIREVDTNGIITTVAGDGTGGYFGDGGPATNANLSYPFTVAVDSYGDLFISDEGNNVIREVDTNGVITTVAGNGTGGYSGDGGAATNANLSSPTGVAVDAVGNLFIGDNGNNVVREVTTNGIITTVAGNNVWGYSGDDGPATNANLSSPADLAVDASGNLFIVDSYNYVIREVDTNGIITTVTGGGPGVAVDTLGDLFIADGASAYVQKMDTNGIFTTVAGNGTQGYSGDGGQATNASLNYAADVVVDPTGNLYIADAWNNVIRKVDANGIISTVAGGGVGDDAPATNAYLNSPTGVAVDASGDLFIADVAEKRIREVNTNGIITTVAGNGSVGYTGDGGPAIGAALGDPNEVFVDTFGNLFIADYGNNVIRKVDTNGIITTVAGNGTGGYFGDGGIATNANLNYPSGVAVDNSGNLFIADGGNNVIREVDTNGIITTVAGNGTGGYFGDGGLATNANFNDPVAVVADASDNLFVGDHYNMVVRKVTPVQGSTFTLNNVSAANAGSYRLVVTGPGISATSRFANLIVATSPLIYQTVLNAGGGIALNFVSQPGSTNVVFCATNLVPPILWQPISTNIAGADGDWQFTDTNTASYQSRYYQSLMQ